MILQYILTYGHQDKHHTKAGVDERLISNDSLRNALHQLNHIERHCSNACTGLSNCKSHVGSRLPGGQEFVGSWRSRFNFEHEMADRWNVVVGLLLKAKEDFAITQSCSQRCQLSSNG
jgi:hypothetical protein